MSKISEREFDTQCRLCTSTEEGHIQIFGPEGECRSLANKIKECLPISVSTLLNPIYHFSVLFCKIECNVLLLPLEIEVLLNGLHRPNLGVTTLVRTPLQLASVGVLQFMKEIKVPPNVSISGKILAEMALKCSTILGMCFSSHVKLRLRSYSTGSVSEGFHINLAYIL